eukprot:6130019-Pyramimonas_sp.AAC.1
MKEVIGALTKALVGQQSQGNIVDVKGNIVDVKGNIVDVKGNGVDVKGNGVDVKGTCVDVNNVDAHLLPRVALPGEALAHLAVDAPPPIRRLRRVRLRHTQPRVHPLLRDLGSYPVNRSCPTTRLAFPDSRKSQI